MSRTVYNVQRDFALSSGLKSQIFWDSYAPHEADILKEKIRILIPDNNAKGENTLEKIRKTLFDSIWLQHSENSTGCCMIFIDETGRVYKNWQDFIKTNMLPKGMMIAPANGVYTFDDDDKVLLETHLTPAAHTKSLLLSTTDTVAGVGGLVATVPMAAALAFPVAAPIMAAATVGAIATAAYTTVRSAMQLQDRGVHGQSVALTDASARRNWLGLASGAIGIGASGATKAITYAATTGREISLGAKIAVNSINASSIVLSGSGVANSFYDLYIKVNNDETISGMDILHLASSMLVLTHSVNNLNIAIKASKGNGVRATARSEISKQMRSLFNTISRNTMTLCPPNSGPNMTKRPFDMIRTVNDIPLNDILQNLHVINANLPTTNSILNVNNARSVGELLISSMNLILKLVTGNNEICTRDLVYELGPRFLQHIRNLNSLREVLNSMAKYLSEKVVCFLLKLTRTFFDEYVDRIEKSLHTSVSAESALYKIFMHCIENYKDFSYKYLESKTCEILNFIDSYFESLNPCSDGVRPTVCNVCNGYFIKCAL